MAKASTQQVDHYEIGAGQRFEIGDDDEEIGAGQRFEIGREELGDRGPSISEDAFPQDVSLGLDEDIGAEAQTALAVREVIKTARDNRQPPPKMRAVSVDDPIEGDPISDWFSDVAVGCGEAIGVDNPFPLMTKLLTRFGAGQEKPRFVRVDTEETYKLFRADNSPDLAEMKDHLEDLADTVERHINDPDAHEDILDAIEEAEEEIGAAVEVQKSKEIDLWLPKWAQGRVRAWREGDWICASICLPGVDGETRICTSMTPVIRAVEEMEAHAAATPGVSAAEIVGVIPSMGCVLGAGTLVKEMAAAAPSLLQRPEAASKGAWECRIEPKATPSLCALAALLCECAKGDKQACAEWDALASAAGKDAPYVSAAMREARDVFLSLKNKKVATKGKWSWPWARKDVIGEGMKTPPRIAPFPGGGGRTPLYRGDTVTIQGR